MIHQISNPMMSSELLSVSDAVLTDALLVDRWWCRVLPWCHASIVQKLRKLSEFGALCKLGLALETFLADVLGKRKRHFVDIVLLAIKHWFTMFMTIGRY